MPLVLGEQPIGVLVLGSPNSEVSADWRQLANMVAGPVAQAVALAESVARLTGSEHRFRGIAESSLDGILLTDAHGDITYVSPSAEQILGAASANVGRQVERVAPFLSMGAQQGNLVRPNGERLFVEISTRTFEDPPGQINRVHVLHDLSDRVRMEELALIASHDTLTGLCNRRGFEELLALRLADSRRHGTPGALLVIDLDHFKAINDTFGHQAGDAVLKEVAQVLREQCRDSDTAARFGGDEFTVLAHRATADGVQVMSSRILEGISALAIPFNGRTLTASASLGIALFPYHGLTTEGLFAAADEALYESKRTGRGKTLISSRPRHGTDHDPPAQPEGSGT